MKIFTITTAFFLIFCFQPLSLKAGPEENEERVIYVQSKSLPAIKGGIPQLIVPMSKEGVEGVKIHPQHKTMMVIRQEGDPVEIEKAFQPALWRDLCYERLEVVIKAHTFYLKQLSDGTFKLDMTLGLLGGGNESSRDSSGRGREGGYGQRGTFGGSI